MMSKLTRAISDDEKHRGETIASYGDIEVYRRINRNHAKELVGLLFWGAFGYVFAIGLDKLYGYVSGDDA